MSRPGPAVSIVVPAYQNAAFIESTVASALSQTFTDFELVISDHGSTDGTWDVLQQYASDSRVRLLRTEAGGGAVRNWSRVSDAAEGRYLKLLCGDDLIYPDCLALQVAALEEHPSAVLTSVRRDLIDVQGRPLLRGRGLGPLVGLVEGAAAIKALVRAGTNLFGEPGCVLMRTEAFRAAGGWHNDFPYLIDQFSYMRLLEHGDLVGVDSTQAAFRLNDGQWSVRLAASQGRQADGVHRFFEAEMPGVVSRGDRRRGTARAHLTAWQRRAAYAVWRRRMRTA